jgi:hypothetical protein
MLPVRHQRLYNGRMDELVIPPHGYQMTQGFKWFMLIGV